MWSETHPLDGTQPPYSKALQDFTINEKHIVRARAVEFIFSKHAYIFFFTGTGFLKCLAV